MIDVHCHLNFHSFTEDYDAVIQEAIAQGITHIINVGTKIDSSKQAITLAEKYNNLFAIVGVHPHHSDKTELESGWLEELDTMAAHPKVVAIGEIGMDFFRYKSNGVVNHRVQKEVFEKQIELAYKHKKPLQIHNRHAGKDIIEILTYHKNSLLPIPGMFHCFAGNREILSKVLAMGFCVGFDGNITYKGLAPGEDTSLSDLAKATPLDRIVLETDSPFLTPEPHRGSRNKPSYVILVGEFIARLKGISVEEVTKQTTENVQRIFHIG